MLVFSRQWSADHLELFFTFNYVNCCTPRKFLRKMFFFFFTLFCASYLTLATSFTAVDAHTRKNHKKSSSIARLAFHLKAYRIFFLFPRFDSINAVNGLGERQCIASLLAFSASSTISSIFFFFFWLTLVSISAVDHLRALDHQSVWNFKVSRQPSRNFPYFSMYFRPRFLLGLAKSLYYL